MFMNMHNNGGLIGKIEVSVRVCQIFSQATSRILTMSLNGTSREFCHHRDLLSHFQ